MFGLELAAAPQHLLALGLEVVGSVGDVELLLHARGAVHFVLASGVVLPRHGLVVDEGLMSQAAAGQMQAHL